MVVAQLASAMPVDVMAGAADPANQALPQQALHACLLPTAAAYPTLHRRGSPLMGALRLRIGLKGRSWETALHVV